MAITLPNWLLKSIPDIPKRVISYVDGRILVDGEPAPADATLVSVYDEYDSNEVELILDESLTPEFGSMVHGMFFANENNRLLLSEGAGNLVSIMHDDYEEWKEVVLPAYEADPDNFFNAYRFVNHHPAFWIMNVAPSNGAWLGWTGDDNVNFGDTRVTISKKGRVRVHFSLNPHSQDDYRSRQHWFGAVKADTFEEAIIKFARKAHATYLPDGSGERAKND